MRYEHYSFCPLLMKEKENASRESWSQNELSQTSSEKFDNHRGEQRDGQRRAGTSKRPVNTVTMNDGGQTDNTNF